MNRAWLCNLRPGRTAAEADQPNTGHHCAAPACQAQGGGGPAFFAVRKILPLCPLSQPLFFCRVVSSGLSASGPMSSISGHTSAWAISPLGFLRSRKLDFCWQSGGGTGLGSPTQRLLLGCMLVDNIFNPYELLSPRL